MGKKWVIEFSMETPKNFSWSNNIVLLTEFGWFKKIFWLDELNFCLSQQIRLH